MDCLICGASQKDRPTIFRNEEFCSDLCKKLLRGEISSAKYEMESGKYYNSGSGLYDAKISQFA